MESPKTNPTRTTSENQSLWNLLEPYDREELEKAISILLSKSIGKSFPMHGGGLAVPLRVDFPYATCLYEEEGRFSVKHLRIGEIGISI